MKEQLEKQLEEVKTEFINRISNLKKEIEALKNEKPISKWEIGKWYKVTQKNIDETGKLGRYKGVITDRYNEFEGLQHHYTIRQVCLADPNEVEEHLITEAKKKPYKKGTIINPIDGRSIKYCLDGFTYIFSEDRLFCGADGKGGPVIYEKGVWAEIVKEDKLFLDKEQKYEIKFGNALYSVMIDGHGFGKEFFLAAERVLTHHKASVLLGCDAKTKGNHSWVLTKELNDKILEKLK